MPIHGRTVSPRSTSCWQSASPARSQPQTRCLAHPYDNGIYPYHLPRAVCHGPSTVTGVDGGVGLYKLLHERDLRLDRPIAAADDCHGDRRPAEETEWRPLAIAVCPILTSALVAF